MTVILPNGIDLTYYYFHYVPNQPLCYVGIALFSIVFIALVFRVFTSNSPQFLYLLPVTALAEVVGFALRYICANNPTTGVYTGMSILLLLSANIMALVNYKAVGDVVQLSGVETRYYVIGPNLTKTFYKSNVIASILTGVGGGMTGSGSSSKTGSALTIVGVVLQLVFFALFLCVVHYVNTCPDYQYYVNNQNSKSKLMKVMYITMGLLFARSVYRLANYIIVLADPTNVHEWTFYVFDALIIAGCFVIHFIWFVGNYLPDYSADLKPAANNYNMNNVGQGQPAGQYYPTPQQQYPPAGYNNA